MAVAEVTSGITEDRPYRKAMDYKNAIKVLTSMADRSALDGDIVQLMTSNVGEIGHVQKTARELASTAYQNSIQTDVLSAFMRI
jgi:HD-GYP domain-containing protein (c-di-GMP phosphodiesterase class II)